MRCAASLAGHIRGGCRACRRHFCLLSDRCGTVRCCAFPHPLPQGLRPPWRIRGSSACGSVGLCSGGSSTRLCSGSPHRLKPWREYWAGCAGRVLCWGWARLQSWRVDHPYAALRATGRVGLVCAAARRWRWQAAGLGGGSTAFSAAVLLPFSSRSSTAASSPGSR